MIEVPPNISSFIPFNMANIWTFFLLVQRWEGGIHMNRGGVGEDRGSKEMDGCPLTLPPFKSTVL
jgi:hypothetical protein